MAIAERSPLAGPKRLGDRLLEAGLITRTQLDQALDRQNAARETRQRVGRTLIELGFVTERDLMQMLAIHFGVAAATSIAEPESEALAALPATVASRYRALPFQLAHGVLRVAIADAPSPGMIENLQRAAGGPIRLYVAADPELDAAVATHYGQAHTALASRLRELAVRLLHLAEESRVVGFDGRLHDELERTRKEIDTLLALLAD